jgi:hypothetical protein
MIRSAAVLWLLGSLPLAFPVPTSASPPASFAEDERAIGAVVPEDPALLAEALSADVQSVGTITNIGNFLNHCPTLDPIYGQIRDDFEIRRNGVVVGAIACSEPVSALSADQYTDELILVQGLRTIYYMDLGLSGHLPWTPGTLYAWMRSKIGGVDIRDGSGSFCCESFGGRLFIAVGAQNDFNRLFDKSWRGISGNIDLYAHETRHVDGFPHVSCCGIANGCDQSFDLANLSPYGIQWFLNKAWLDGDINVGFACLPAAEFQETVNWHLDAVNSQFASRFCTNAPAVVPTPANPGGGCAETPPAGPWLSTSSLSGFEVKVRISGQRLGTLVTPCIAETMCVAGAVPGRAEVFVRVVGPKPNGYLWPTLVKFSTSTVEVWIRQVHTQIVRYYRLAGASGPNDDTLPGLFDRTGFRP